MSKIRFIRSLADRIFQPWPGGDLRASLRLVRRGALRSGGRRIARLTTPPFGPHAFRAPLERSFSKARKVDRIVFKKQKKARLDNVTLVPPKFTETLAEIEIFQKLFSHFRVLHPQFHLEMI